MNRKKVISVCTEGLNDLVYLYIDEDIRKKYCISETEDIDMLYDVESLLENEINLPKDFLDRIEILELPEGYSVEYIEDSYSYEIYGPTELIIGKDIRRLRLFDKIESGDYKGVGLLPEDRALIKDFIVPFKSKEKE